MTTAETSARKDAVGFSGLGAATCAACCAGPIIGLLAAAGLSTVAGVALVGAIGLVVLIPAAGYLRRRRATAACAWAEEGPVPVELGSRP